jgi:hypothetical protein
MKHATVLLIHHTQQIGSRENVSGFCLEGARFESRHYATSISFHILPGSRFIITHSFDAVEPKLLKASLNELQIQTHYFFFLYGAAAHIGPWRPLYEVP